MLYVEKIENHKIGNRTPFADVARSLGWILTIDENNTEKAYDGSLWEKGYAPAKPEPTKEEQQKARQEAYKNEVDPITCHINRLKDEEQTPEVIAEIASLVEERKAKVEEIKQRFPYPVEETKEVIEDGLQR